MYLYIAKQAYMSEANHAQWGKIDAQLCSVLCQFVDLKALQHLQAYKTCYKFRTQSKSRYTNDIHRLYKVISSIVNLKQNGWIYQLISVKSLHFKKNSCP